MSANDNFAVTRTARLDDGVLLELRFGPSGFSCVWRPARPRRAFSKMDGVIYRHARNALLEAFAKSLGPRVELAA
jgi:hypothetical protein